MMDDEWWMMDDGCWMLDDEWWMMNDDDAVHKNIIEDLAAEKQMGNLAVHIIYRSSMFDSIPMSRHRTKKKQNKQ